jgi:hypothetical protein
MTAPPPAPRGRGARRPPPPAPDRVSYLFHQAAIIRPP